MPLKAGYQKIQWHGKHIPLFRLRCFKFKFECFLSNLSEVKSVVFFLQLIRKFFKRSLILLQSHDWKEGYIQRLVNILSGHVLNSTVEDVPTGIKLHIADIYLHELEKVGIGEVGWIQLLWPRLGTFEHFTNWLVRIN